MRADWDDGPRLGKWSGKNDSILRVVGMMAIFSGALILVFINKYWEPGKRIQWV